MASSGNAARPPRTAPACAPSNGATKVSERMSGLVNDGAPPRASKIAAPSSKADPKAKGASCLGRELVTRGTSRANGNAQQAISNTSHVASSADFSSIIGALSGRPRGARRMIDIDSARSTTVGPLHTSALVLQVDFIHPQPLFAPPAGRSISGRAAAGSRGPAPSHIISARTNNSARARSRSSADCRAHHDNLCRRRCTSSARARRSGAWRRNDRAIQAPVARNRGYCAYTSFHRHGRMSIVRTTHAAHGQGQVSTSHLACG